MFTLRSTVLGVLSWKELTSQKVLRPASRNGRSLRSSTSSRHAESSGLPDGKLIPALYLGEDQARIAGEERLGLWQRYFWPVDFRGGIAVFIQVPAGTERAGE